MTQPAAEQLLNLANRAEHGLTPAEVQRLRDGITQLHDWLTSAWAVARSAQIEMRIEAERARRAEQTEAEQRIRAVKAEAAIERVRTVAYKWSIHRGR